MDLKIQWKLPLQLHGCNGEKAEGYFSRRINVEEKLFDIAEETSGSSRPIYGYARVSSDFTTGGSYGTAFFNINPDPLADISITPEDSFAIQDKTAVIRKSGGTTEGSSEFSEGVKRLVNRNATETAGDARLYAEIQFHDRVGLKDVQSIDLIRTDPASGEAIQMGHTGIDYEAFGKMSKEEQANFMEVYAKEQQQAAARIKTSLTEKGFPDIEVRTGFLNRELVGETKNPNYIPGARGRGNPEYIAEYAERVVYDTGEELAENKIGLLDALRRSHLDGSTLEGNFARAHDVAASTVSPSMTDLKAAIAAAKESADRSAAIASEVIESSPMSQRTVSKIMEAGETAAQVMRFRL